MTETLCRMKLTLGEVEACPQGARHDAEHARQAFPALVPPELTGH